MPAISLVNAKAAKTCATICFATAIAHSAINSPTAPPSIASEIFSTISCLIKCPRIAPRADLTAISRSRVYALAISRFAKLLPAVIKTRPTAPKGSVCANARCLYHSLRERNETHLLMSRIITLKSL